jgi:ketosteroid isomerase-like protein
LKRDPSHIEELEGAPPRRVFSIMDNVELVKRSFEAISAWDVDALLRLYDPDVELLPLTGTRVESGGYRGHDGVRDYMAEARDLWDVLEPEGRLHEDLGDRVLVAGHCRVRGRSSGAESDPATSWVIHIRNGRIVSHRACATYGEAAELAGVEPAADSAVWLRRRSLPAPGCFGRR